MQQHEMPIRKGRFLLLVPFCNRQAAASFREYSPPFLPTNDFHRGLELIPKFNSTMRTRCDRSTQMYKRYGSLFYKGITAVQASVPELNLFCY
jgi:hypothetical protein